MYTRNFDSDDQLKTNRVGSNTRTYDYELDRLISQSDNTAFKLWGYDAQ